MSTIKSSSENLTLNADGVGKDVVIKNNGTETVRVDSSGTVTATSLTADTLTNQDIQLCKAWVKFNGGSLVIADSFNVSSITYVNTGDHEINITTPFANTNGCIVTGVSNESVTEIPDESWIIKVNWKDASTIRTNVESAGLTESNVINIMVAVFAGDS